MEQQQPSLKNKAAVTHQRALFLIDTTRPTSTYLDRLTNNIALTNKTQAILESTFSSQSKCSELYQKTGSTIQTAYTRHKVSHLKNPLRTRAKEYSAPSDVAGSKHAIMQTDQANIESELMAQKAKRSEIEVNIKRNIK